MAIPTKRAILIAGPTASGKSGVAAAVAERLGGIVVNADSMQVYRDLRILTARPSTFEEARVPHRLFGQVDGASAYSVGLWLQDVRVVLAEAAATGQVPVFVGGTGLYLKALIRGLSTMPVVPPAVRDRIRAESHVRTPAELHARLSACDPVTAARLRPTDPQRIVRALEVFEATGTSLATFHEAREPPLLPTDAVVGVVLAPDRADLYANIGLRLDTMIAHGALAEVERLWSRGLDTTLPVMRALGVAQLREAVANPALLPSAADAAKLATRRYAKRQLTFARHQLTEFGWIDPHEAFSTILARWSRGRPQ